MISISQHLYELRKSNGLSLSEASRIANVNRCNIYRYEKNLSRIPVESLAKLAAAYGVTISSIVDEDDDNV